MKNSYFSLIIAAFLLILSGCGLEDDTREKVAKRSESASASTLVYVNGCTECHEIRSSIEGPSWQGIARHYRERADAKEYLKDRVRNGGEPNWAKITGGADMHATGNRVSSDHLDRILDYILSVK